MSKPHTKTILLLVGESGSGKSTVAKQYIERHPNFIRLNRDELRIELSTDPMAPKGSNFERFVAKIEKSRATEALKKGLSVLVDNTHLNPNTRAGWEDFARHKAEFKIWRMSTSLEDCIARDNLRTGSNHVGRAVIERQFLMSGRLPIDRNKKIVLVDVDGTVADSSGVRSPYDESKVHLDKPYPVIIKLVQELKKDHYIFMVSGRHSTCGDATIEWLGKQQVPFDHIFMRHSFDNRSDVMVKEDILQELLKIVPIEQISQSLDDRWRVISECWRKYGIRCIPVRGTPHHSLNCKYQNLDHKETCIHCHAIGNF